MVCTFESMLSKHWPIPFSINIYTYTNLVLSPLNAFLEIFEINWLLKSRPAVRAERPMQFEWERRWTWNKLISIRCVSKYFCSWIFYSLIWFGPWEECELIGKKWLLSESHLPLSATGMVAIFKMARPTCPPSCSIKGFSGKWCDRHRPIFMIGTGLQI